uniref:Chemosensory protein n=2 Tax=Neoptera TaxID=33340 RepID=A0A6M9BNH8_9NEOP|nr:chemosensory protein [Histia rhodope]
MNSLVLFGLIALACVAGAEELYTSRFDSIDIDAILQNKKLLNSYVQCALDKATCTAEGKELKSHIKDALQNRCTKCTEPQKMKGRRAIKHLINEEPELWSALTDHYDPTKIYTVQYEKELKEIKQ